ncbi:MAG TPA: cyclic-di-AMP receptor [Anaerolineales bacterium]|nr:cyclic-di-AMP receptor [Anaerolineales bacterium]
MKLMIAIVNDVDYDKIAHQLTEAQYRVTCIASTGGLFRRGSTTLLMGLEEEKINQATEIIKEHSTSSEGPGTHKATIFVLNIKEYIHL